VLVFDGDCGFCRRCADWVAVRGEVPMAASAEVDLANLGLTAEEAASSAWWVEEGERLSGHRAVARVLRELGGAWGLAGRLLAVSPFSWLGGPAYRWVAANRHRFG